MDILCFFKLLFNTTPESSVSHSSCISHKNHLELPQNWHKTQLPTTHLLLPNGKQIVISISVYIKMRGEKNKAATENIIFLSKGWQVDISMNASMFRGKGSIVWNEIVQIYASYIFVSFPGDGSICTTCCHHVISVKLILVIYPDKDNQRAINNLMDHHPCGVKEKLFKQVCKWWERDKQRQHTRQGWDVQLCTGKCVIDICRVPACHSMNGFGVIEWCLACHWWYFAGHQCTAGNKLEWCRLF